MDNQSYLGNSDVTAIDALYAQYLQDPNSVDISWRRFFEGFDFQKQQFEVLLGGSTDAGETGGGKEYKVMNLINGYRQRGHLFTKTNPVRERRKHLPTLTQKALAYVDPRPFRFIKCRFGNCFPLGK